MISASVMKGLKTSLNISELSEQGMIDFSADVFIYNDGVKKMMLQRRI